MLCRAMKQDETEECAAQCNEIDFRRRGASHAPRTRGEIIGVKRVRVNCLEWKGTPITYGKSKGQPLKVVATISLPKELPAAKALYAVHVNSLFGEGGRRRGEDDADEDDAPLADEADE